MKKLIVLLPFILGLALWSCEEVTVPNPGGTSTTNYYNNNNNSNGVPYFNWVGCQPQTPIFLGRTLVSGYTNVYDNFFKIYLGGSLVDPNPLYISSFSIPHVGPGGQTIYVNVINDATYTITSIDNTYLYYTIRCTEGSTLKYNIAKFFNGDWRWFLRYDEGYKLNYDDGINNIYTVNL
jgi:hypothetical protein